MATKQKKRVLVIDNYDSFTYNLVQYLETLGASCDVRLNDETTVAAIGESKPQALLLSPGPGRPDDAGITLAAIGAFAGKLPIFGVCLGHQSIGQAFGAKVVRAQRLMHGKTSDIIHNGGELFRGLPGRFTATRYHSLVVDPLSMPDCLEITARTDDNEIMALKHKQLRVEGVQFHPESILTEVGMNLVSNWLESV